MQIIILFNTRIDLKQIMQRWETRAAVPLTIELIDDPVKYNFCSWKKTPPD